MDIEKLRMLFGCKIYDEYSTIRTGILEMSKREIYDKSYYIDCVICIYEILLELSKEMDQEELICLLVHPNLLDFLYDRWLRTEDIHYEEMEICIQQGIVRLEQRSVA